MDVMACLQPVGSRAARVTSADEGKMA